MILPMRWWAFRVARATWATVVLLAVPVRSGEPPSGSSSSSTVRVEWSAPARCPDQRWVTGRTEAFLGRTIARAASTEGVARFDVVESAGTFSAHSRIVLGDSEQRRELSDPDCVVVADAAAFVLASAIDPGVQYSDAPPLDEASPPTETDAPTAPEAQGTVASRATPPKAAPPPRAAAIPPARATPRAEPAHEPHSVTPTFGVSGGVLVGPLPGPAARVGVGAAIAVDRFAATLAAEWALPQESFDGASPGGSYQRVGSALDVCVLALDGRLSVPLCARAEAGAVFGEGRGLSPSERATLPWVGLGGAVALSVNLGGGFAVGPHVAVTGGLVRPRFLTEGGNLVHVADEVSLAASLALSWGPR